jgi:hypothetical protein
VLIACPNCNSPLPETFSAHPHVENDCPQCGTNLAVTLFPALFRPAAKIDPQSLVTTEGDATCFEHANKRAVAVCNKCGRFLCALCEVELAGKVWCPSCLIPANTAGPIQALEKRRTLFDSIALALATLPALLFFYPSLFTAPVILYLGIRYWKKPSSIIPRGKWRFIVALLIATLELGGVAVLVIAVIVQQSKTGAIPK